MPKKSPAAPKGDQPESAAPLTLLPEQLLALSRVGSQKLLASAREQLQAGKTYDVDFGVRVTGQLTVGHDSPYTVNNSPKAVDVVAALLAQFGPRKRQQIVQELLVNGIPRTIAPDEKPIEGLAELSARLIDGLTTTTKGNRRGSVVGACTVQVVEWS